ncbi:MAG: PAS domain-containing protein [Candidatus Krumholzibacteriota bacterium]|nr:PAS domain-containing protein [Candidatus Krumholzibacteriota bacterium]
MSTKKSQDSIEALRKEMEKCRQAEIVLRESQERYNLAMAVTNDGLWDWNLLTDEVYFDPRYYTMAGYEPEEFPHKFDEFSNRVHPDDLEEVMTQAKAHLAGEIPVFDVEFRFQRKDGTWIWVRGRGKIVEKDEKGAPTRMVGTHSDIGPRKKAEKILRDSEERFKLAAKVASDIIYEWDIDSDKLSWFGNIDSALGFEKGEFPHTIEAWVKQIHPEDQVKLRKAVELHRTSVEPIFEEYRIKTKDGLWLQWVDRGVPILDDSGKPKRWVGVCIDITDRKRTEQKRLELERQIQHAQKLESLGILAGGIAHDFNNLLLGVLGNADLALSELPAESPIRKRIQHIETAALRATELTKQMLAYSGKGRYLVEELDMNEMIEEMSNLLEVVRYKNVEIKYDFSKELPAVKADVVQMHQVVMNLLTNASEAIGKYNGVVSISTGVMECDRECLNEIYLDKDLPEGPYVYIEVADTGCGMDEDTKSSIFDPFFTTKFAGRGLGMAAVLGIVRGHKGAIKIDSEVGKGTKIKVLFPAMDHTAASAEELMIEMGMEREWGGTVLMVDDEDTVLSVGKAMLEKLGLSVLTAEDGKIALKVFKEHKDEICCVVLDLTMPNMSGEETFRELRRLKSDVKVIMSSGYNEVEVVNRFSGKKLTGFIQKPYRRADLIKVLNKVMADGCC